MYFWSYSVSRSFLRISWWGSASDWESLIHVDICVAAWVSDDGKEKMSWLSLAKKCACRLPYYLRLIWVMASAFPPWPRVRSGESNTESNAVINMNWLQFIPIILMDFEFGINNLHSWCIIPDLWKWEYKLHHSHRSQFYIFDKRHVANMRLGCTAASNGIGPEALIQFLKTRQNSPF